MIKNKKFDDEYNQLFTKPTRKRLISSKSVIGKILTRQPGDRRIKTSWIIIIFLSAVILYFSRFFLLGLFQGNKEDSQQVYPLKEADIRQNSVIDLSKPLVATLDNHILTFNRDYQLEILGEADIQRSSKELSVLPTKDEYVYEKEAANITFYKDQDLDRTSEISISGNLIKSETDSVSNDKTDFIKAYPQTNVGDIKQGYIIDYSSDSGNILTTIKKYYIFSDGTGFTIELYSNNEKKLSSKSSLKDIQKKYADDFAFLSEHFKLVKQT